MKKMEFYSIRKISGLVVIRLRNGNGFVDGIFVINDGASIGPCIELDQNSPDDFVHGAIVLIQFQSNN